MTGEHFSTATHAAAIGVGDTVLYADAWREVTGANLTGDEVTLELEGGIQLKVGSDDRLQRSLGLMSDC